MLNNLTNCFINGYGVITHFFSGPGAVPLTVSFTLCRITFITLMPILIPDMPLPPCPVLIRRPHPTLQLPVPAPAFLIINCRLLPTGHDFCCHRLQN